MMKKGISLVGFRKAEEVSRIAGLFPQAFFELSYAMSDDFLRSVAPAIGGRIASLHSLCPRRSCFPNFASADESVFRWSYDEMLRDAGTARSLGADIQVLHPGYLIPSLIPTDTKERLALMESGVLSPYTAIKAGSICTDDYPEREEYRRAFELMIPALENLSAALNAEGITLAVENLNPRAGYMLVKPEEMLELARRTELSFTLDIGHLWVSAERFGFDFLTALEKVLTTGRVVTTHLHSNPSDRDSNLYADTHSSLDAYRLPWQDALKMIAQSGANMMLETTEDPEHNLDLLFSI